MGKREHIYEIIAENIRKERRRLGITQAELAERADVSLDTIKSVGLSTLFQTNFFRLFFRYCTGV